MTLNKLYFIAVAMIICCSCGDRKKSKTECLAEVPPYLSSIVEQSQMKSFLHLIENIEKEQDKKFFQDYYDIVALFSGHLSFLVEKSGGVHTKEFKLINPCRLLTEKELETHNFFVNKLFRKLELFQGKYKNLESDRDIIRFLDYSLNSYFKDVNANLSEKEAKDESISLVITKLLLLQSSLSSYGIEVLVKENNK